MARQRDPKRDKSFEIWKQHNGEITNRAIAEQLGIDEKKIAVWKQRDKWNVVQQNKKNVVQQNPSKKKKDEKEPVIESDELTEKQRLFCLYYIKSFNGTMAAIKAGYAPSSAHVRASELVRNSKVSAEIKRLKGKMADELFIDALDVLNKYVAIAFADITDYATFGMREVPMVDDEGNVEVVMRNYLDFKESDKVDGTIITEVKQGKDGVSIKLADRMKAFEKLDIYFDLLPDHFKREVEKEKLRAKREEVEIKRKEAEQRNKPPEPPNIGVYIDALKGRAAEVWSDEDSE